MWALGSWGVLRMKKSFPVTVYLDDIGRKAHSSQPGLSPFNLATCIIR